MTLIHLFVSSSLYGLNSVYSLSFLKQGSTFEVLILMVNFLFTLKMTVAIFSVPECKFHLFVAR